jgi:hypothetical protein
MILEYVEMLQEAQGTVAKIEERFQEFQTFHLDDSWPIPYPRNLWHPNGLPYTENPEPYGLHHGLTGSPMDSYYAVAILNATGHWHLLNQPTPRVQKTWLNLVELSAPVAAITTLAMAAALVIQRRKQKLPLATRPV